MISCDTTHSPSSCSETSIMSCSKQIADLDALIIELQRKAEDDTHNPGVDMEDTTDWDSSLQEGSGEDNGNLTSSVEVLADGERNPLKQVGLLDSTMTVRNKLIGDVQKEKILNDCKNQIKVGFFCVGDSVTCLSWIMEDFDN